MREECVDLVPQTFRLHCVGKESEENKNSSALSAGNSGTSAVDEEQSLVDDSSLCSTSPIGSAPLCRQFWKAGSYDDTLSTKPSLQSISASKLSLLLSSLYHSVLVKWWRWIYLGLI